MAQAAVRHRTTVAARRAAQALTAVVLQAAQALTAAVHRAVLVRSVVAALQVRRVAAAVAVRRVVAADNNSLKGRVLQRVWHAPCLVMYND